MTELTRLGRGFSAAADLLVGRSFGAGFDTRPRETIAEHFGEDQ